MAWLEGISVVVGDQVTFPLIGDPSYRVMKLYNMLQDTAHSQDSAAIAEEKHVTRSVFLIAPDRTIRLMLVHPNETDRNVDEILRVIKLARITF